MSFGSDNPELYGEICKQGIVNKLRSELSKNGYDDIDEPTLEAIVEIIYESPKAFNVFSGWANDEICAAEGDYWGGKIDEAVMRHESEVVNGITSSGYCWKAQL